MIAGILGILVAAPLAWYIVVLMTSDTVFPDRKQWFGLVFYVVVAIFVFWKKFLTFKNTKF